MSDLVGRILQNRYRVDSFIGRGGMADVYKVWDQKRAVFLAMKVLHSDLAEDRVFLRRFKREAATLAKLQHPHIVRSYGLDVDGAIAFILMDYVEGVSLRKRIFDLNRPFTPDEVLEIMQPVCSGLHYAHQNSIVHCDIKPANIMIHKNGTVLVSDFGISRITEAATATMIGAGTPAYMSPEQARGEDLFPQSDIYSLGIVLYEMLSGGERPFTGERAKTTGGTGEKVRWEQINIAPPALNKANPQVSTALEAVVVKCLQKDSAQRYPNTLDALNALIQADGNTVSQTALPKALPVISAEPLPEHPELSVKNDTHPVGQPVSNNNLFRKHSLTFLMVGMALLMLAFAAFFVFIVRPSSLTIEHTVTKLPTATSALMLTATSSPFATLTPTLVLSSTVTLTPESIITLSIGSTQISKKDNMLLVFVPKGEFIMGSSQNKAFSLCNSVYWGCKVSWFSDVAPEHIVSVNDFWIDITEITNKMYKICIDDNACSIPPTNDSDPYAGNDYFYTAYDEDKYQDYPIVRVSWLDANTYCKWAGRRLPTEAEWEKAARSNDGRIYPWGDKNPNDTLIQNKQLGIITHVGQFPSGASPYGVLDMEGNVWEWVFDWYDPNYYANSMKENPIGPSSGTSKSLRGGYHEIISNSAPLMIRNWAVPTMTSNHIGFRCALSVYPQK